jgi:hypothetical protein
VGWVCQWVGSGRVFTGYPQSEAREARKGDRRSGGGGTFAGGEGKARLISGSSGEGFVWRRAH